MIFVLDSRQIVQRAMKCLLKNSQTDAKNHLRIPLTTTVSHDDLEMN